MIKKNNNFLLQKDDVGMPKPTVRDLPLFGHSYGLPGARDTEGVKHCKCKRSTGCSTWAECLLIIVF